MSEERPLRIGITCYPSIGGSGILACALGEQLARRGHNVHFISYERPVRLPEGLANVSFHPVQVNDYRLFRHRDYTLPLSVKMAEVARDHRLDVLHVHYAVPHATAAVLARQMLPASLRPAVVTTLHGTDTTLLGRDPGYGPAIRHALEESDAVTAVSQFLRDETHRLLGVERTIDVVHNFFEPQPATRTRDEVRHELGLSAGEAMILHHSNLRPVKRIDLLLAAVARIPKSIPFKLVVLAGDDFRPFQPLVCELDLTDRVVVRAEVTQVEDYLQAADLGLFTSESESFCLSILEAMAFGCPSVSTAVGGIPEVVEDGLTGLLVPDARPEALARSLTALLTDAGLRAQLGAAARAAAKDRFSAQRIVGHYLAVYRRARGARA